VVVDVEHFVRQVSIAHVDQSPSSLIARSRSSVNGVVHRHCNDLLAEAPDGVLRGAGVVSTDRDDDPIGPDLLELGLPPRQTSVSQPFDVEVACR
jgi:hypothetical protein